MITYLVDSNLFLRLILKDNVNQWQKAYDHFIKAKRSEIKLIFIPEIITEIEFVLRKTYKKSRAEITQYLTSLLAASYIEIDNREIIQKALAIYQHRNIHIIDLILYFSAEKRNCKILSFDKQLLKLTV